MATLNYERSLSEEAAYAAEWKENLPDLTPNAYGYYRKLILV